MVEISGNYDELPEMIKGFLKEKGNIFFQKEYETYAQIRKEQLVYVYDDNFVIPVKNRKAFFFQFGLFLSEPLCLRGEALPNTKKFLNDAAETLAEIYHLQWLYAPASATFSDFPDGSKVIPWGNYILDLENREEETLLMGMHSKHRNAVRRAEKNKVFVKQGATELLEDYLSLDRETWERSRQSSSGKEYYLQILKAMPENTRIFIAYKEEVPQAGALIFYNQVMGYYMYGATKNAPEAGAANLLQWEVIRFLKEYGTRQYSFVGCRIKEEPDSKYHGIQRFKERFGGKLQEGYLFRKEIRPGMYRLFCLAMQMRSENKWKRYQDAIDEEIHKWKDLQE
ncbi:MAG: aminoacyltransferase [Lachnospiraceae bacterium]|nr:aminoacyltransferase [Lachnospiraceae bacterium]